ncbi:AbrB/MazE/SpoVT family DNA-binding domain-containing protein [Termitidicoccus mucosus]|uniref:Uncharacterized protein n=1 Tax=Termitidicoccus mucosus TaxID=1184151 RepID=A0A178IPK4_9BACT|nr:hypothetical protein AW736_02195 [Opitutaceae bacterium TSB47]
MSDSITVKVFKSGNSQAVRLPKDFRFSGKTAQLIKTPKGVLLIDPRVQARRRAALRKLWGSAPDFPEVR